VRGRVCTFLPSFPITTIASLGFASFWITGLERAASSPHFGQAKTIVFSFFVGTSARLHFEQNCISDNDRVLTLQQESDLTLPHSLMQKI